jgi:lipopolysaccharide assembly LptE-like protein
MKWVVRFALVSVFVLSGCYTLGPVTPTYMKGVHSLSVPIFDNKSFEPQVQALVTDTFIKDLQTDGTYPITGEDQADAIVHGTITDVIRTQTKAVVGDVLASAEFQITLKIHIQVLRGGTGQVLVDKDFNGQSYFFVGSDLPTQERQAIPVAAQDCAKQVTAFLTEGF